MLQTCADNKVLEQGRNVAEAPDPVCCPLLDLVQHSPCAPHPRPLFTLKLHTAFILTPLLGYIYTDVTPNGMPARGTLDAFHICLAPPLVSS